MTSKADFSSLLGRIRQISAKLPTVSDTSAIEVEVISAGNALRETPFLTRNPCFCQRPWYVLEKDAKQIASEGRSPGEEEKA